MPIRETIGLAKDSVVQGLLVNIQTPTPEPEPDVNGLLRVDHWHLTAYIDDDLIIDAPDSYFLSQPDNGFVWPDNWIVDAATAGYGLDPVWGAGPVDTTYGPFFAGGSFWLPWWKNIYWDSASDLLNNMQGTDILPFTDPFTSHSIQTYTGGSGKAMRGGVSDGFASLLGDETYERDDIGTMWTALYDVSSYHMGGGNAHTNGISFEVPSQSWTPWGGAVSYSFGPYQSLFLPLQDGDDHIEHDWSLSHLLYTLGGPAGDYTTGPGFATTMSVDDTDFHTIKIEVTYNGHDYGVIEPGQFTPYD